MLDVKVETFLSVCRHMNFTRASEELHITQSAVSQQIKSLEEYYGTKLFTYKNRSLSLTDNGKYLKQCMESMYHDTIRIKDLFKNDIKIPSLKIGTTMSIGNFFLPKYFSDFMKKKPNVKLSVTCMDTKHILERLDSGILDFAFIEGYFNKEKYAFKTIKKDEIILAASKNYETDSIKSIEDLFYEPFIIREEGSGTRSIFCRYLSSIGCDIENFKNCSVFNSPRIIKELLINGSGISVIYRTVIEDCLKSGTLKEIKIPGFPIPHEYSAIWKKESLFKSQYENVIEELIPQK